MHKVTSWVSAAFTVAAGVTFAHSAHAQAWKPERPVEITVPSGPGGSNDVAGRVIQKLFDDLKLLGQPSSVVNRDGGGHTIAYSYVQQRAGDPHRIGIMSTPILMNFVEGRTQMSYKDVTPIAYMITEPMVAAVRADSPIKTGQDLLNALKKDPNSLSIALTSVGHRVSIGIPMQKAGVDTKGVRVVVFKSGGETTTAVLGGHADVVVTSVSSLVPHQTGGKLRGIAVSADQRLGGPLASIPTWKELGYVSSGSWKGIVAPPNITPAQIAFWEQVSQKAAQSKEIAEYAEKNQWLVEFKNAAETRKWMEEETARLQGVLTALGLTKRGS
jgi:putative tricarboxylic transport membrane protein